MKRNGINPKVGDTLVGIKNYIIEDYRLLNVGEEYNVWRDETISTLFVFDNMNGRYYLNNNWRDYLEFKPNPNDR